MRLRGVLKSALAAAPNVEPASRSPGGVRATAPSPNRHTRAVFPNGKLALWCRPGEGRPT